MAIATATMTPSLTPSQRAAREFWRQAGADGMPPFYVMSQYYALLSSDNLSAVTAALNQLLTGLGYETDVDTVFNELAAGQGEELGYWAGRYCLFDDGGNRFDLVVGRNGATLTVPPALVDLTKLPAGTDLASVTVLSGAKFSDGVLELANAQFQVSLRFTLPVSDATLDTGAAAFQSTAPLCNGTFVVVHPWWQRWGFGPSSRPVDGKRGAWTQAGVSQTDDGDPAAAWYGQYVLLDLTEVMAVVQAGGADAATASVVQVPEPVCIYNDPSFGLTFQWGDRYGGNVTYNNNVLQCADEDDDTTQYAMQFVAPQPSGAEINLAVTTAGVVRSYKGYWVGRYPPPSPAPQARLAKRPMTAVYTAAAGASAGGYSQAIDVSSLTPDPKPNKKITLPYGAVGNNYALTLNLTNCGATDTFSWKLTPGGGGNDATDRATITPSDGANQTVQFSLNNLSDSDIGPHLQVTVQLTKTSATPAVTYTLLFDIAVIKCDAITIEPTVLSPVVVGTPYSQKLTASGAPGNFTWSIVSSSLPPRLTWDPSSHQLSGTVTDASQTGKAFSLVVGLAASDVIMNPLTSSLSITVQSGQAVASNMPAWEAILLCLAVPCLMSIGIIGAAIVNRIKQGIEKAKTDEAIRAFTETLENATNHSDIKVLGQSIIRAENATLPIIIETMVPLEKEISDVIQQQDALSRSIDETQQIIYKLDDYLAEHRDDEPETPVEDQYIRDDLHYHTFREAELGMGDLMSLNLGRGNELRDSMGYGNALQATITSHQNSIDNASSSESNDRRLLADE